MSKRVLVLNQDYTALSICSVNKAFLLVYLEKAETVAVSDGILLRSMKQNFAAPSIIRLHHYVSLPFRAGVVMNRQNVFKRDGNTCQYCGSPKDLTLDHVMPRSRGGKSTWVNLITACKNCNSRKGDDTPEEANMPLFSLPYKPSFVMFLRDFSGRVSDDWLLYLGKRHNHNK